MSSSPSSRLMPQQPEAMTTSAACFTRDRPILPGRTALLIIDVQNATCGPTQKAEKPEFYSAATSRVIPSVRRLLAAFRSVRLEVIYTVIENLTDDGRDRSLDYKLSNMSVVKGSWEAQVLAEIAPQPGEIVLSKTSSSVFNSTILDYLLRNIGIEDVFVAGFLTDQCIDHAIKDGADRGYYMNCVHDACAAESDARHEAALSCFKGYCRMLATEDVLKLAAAPQ
jgi:nicotinamidase-related amidase